MVSELLINDLAWISLVLSAKMFRFFQDEKYDKKGKMSSNLSRFFCVKN